MPEKNDVVCTGMGITTPFAATVGEFQRHLMSEERLENWLHRPADAGGFDKPGVCSINEHLFADIRGAKYFDKCTKLLYSTVSQFIGENGYGGSNNSGTAISVGTAYSSLSDFMEFLLSFENGGPRGINPILFPNTVHNCPASQLAILLKVTGANITVTNGLCSGLDALAVGMEFARTGRATRVIVGGVDEKSDYLKTGIEACLNECSEAQVEVVEAAGAIAIETRESAERRNATIYGKIVSYAQGFFPGGVHEDCQLSGLIEATIRNALAAADLSIDDIGTISLSLNGLPSLDKAELIAIARLLEDTRIPKSLVALKRLVGETGGATGILQVIAAFSGADSALLRNHAHVLPEDFVRRNKAKLSEVAHSPYCLVNNVDWAGHFTSAILKRGDGLQ